VLERPLSGYFRLPVGDKYTTPALNLVVQKTMDLLKSEGYFQASVTADTALDEENHLAVVTLKAKAGPPAKVGMVHLSGGEETFPKMELAKIFNLKPGDDFTTARLEKARSDIRAKFTELSFLSTRVNIVPDLPDAY